MKHYGLQAGQGFSSYYNATSAGTTEYFWGIYGPKEPLNDLFLFAGHVFSDIGSGVSGYVDQKGGVINAAGGVVSAAGGHIKDGAEGIGAGAAVWLDGDIGNKLNAIYQGNDMRVANNLMTVGRGGLLVLDVSLIGGVAAKGAQLAGKTSISAL